MCLLLYICDQFVVPTLLESTDQNVHQFSVTNEANPFSTDQKRITGLCFLLPIYEVSQVGFLHIRYPQLTPKFWKISWDHVPPSRLPLWTHHCDFNMHSAFVVGFFSLNFKILFIIENKVLLKRARLVYDRKWKSKKKKSRRVYIDMCGFNWRFKIVEIDKVDSSPLWKMLEDKKNGPTLVQYTQTF